ncbi:MAG: PAS domain S-box protein [Gammaproteobacteria bacterium]
MKVVYVIAWLTIFAFLGWSGNLLMRIQTYWAETNNLHSQQKDLGTLTTALQNLNRPGNDVLEHYHVTFNQAQFENYSRQFQTALDAVMKWAPGEKTLDPLITSLHEEQTSMSARSLEIFALAGEREALRMAGASQDSIREKETLAATNMARMDQAFQNGLQILLLAKEYVVEQELEMELLQRDNFKELYIMLFVALVASGLSVELIRRTIRQREALRDSSTRINAIMNNVVDGIITVDEKGRVESSNPAADSMFGYRKNALVGLPFINLLEPACQKRYLEQVNGYKGTAVTPFTLVDCEQPGKRKDDSCFPMDLAVSQVTVQGRRLLIHIVRDITVRRRAEDSMRQAASVFENINEGIIVTDANGTIQSVNPAFTQITQYSKEEAVGKNPRLLQSGIQDKAFYKDMWASILESGTWQGEVWNRRKNGETYPEWLTINTIKDERGRTINYLGVTWDITELKASERMMEEFIATVSHELRTPLTSVLGSLGLLIQGDGGPIPDKANKLVHMAYSNSGRLVRLVSDILDFEKMSAGKMKFQLKVQKLLPLIQQTINSNSAISVQSGVTIELVKSTHNVLVTCDAERLMQAVTNLLSNAIKFSTPGDRVEVAVTRQQQNIRIAVTDHGPGIPEHAHAEIFKKFTQLDAPNQQHKSGIGLGLSIAKLITQKHDGNIYVESRPGVHTTFSIELPEFRNTSDSSRSTLKAGLFPVMQTVDTEMYDAGGETGNPPISIPRH